MLQQELIILRYGVGSVTPAKQAQIVNQRLQAILQSPPPTLNLRTERTDIGWLVSLAIQPIISVTERDAEAEK